MNHRAPLPPDYKIKAAQEALLDLRKRLIAAGLTDADICGVLFTEAAALLIAGLGPQRAGQHFAQMASQFMEQGGPASRH